ncbi:MAG: ExeA family protein [Betaproteobacteria bacterium]
MALYLDHFGLAEPPFRITPHPEFFFDGADRGATLEALVYAILHDEGIVKVSGEIGSGKTMLCRVLMERLPAKVQTLFLANPSYSRAEILSAIAEELGARPPAGQDTLAIRDLQMHLIEQYASGRRVVILIDEAHAMPQDALEQVRLLSNLESSHHKLLQIVLFGQPELDAALDASSMRQLKDRITHSFRMRPLLAAEIAKYLSFRMRAAGYRGPDAFDADATAAISRASSGLTRRVNVLADKSLLAAFAAGANSVTLQHARAAIADSEFAPIRKPGDAGRGRRLAIGAALIACGALAGAGLYALLLEQPVPAAMAPAPAAPRAPVAEAPRPEPVAVEPKPEPVAVKPEPEPAPTVATVPLLAEAQVQRLLAYATGGKQLLAERVAASRQALERTPDASYSLELFTAENSDPARMERFLVRARDLVALDELHVVPVLAGRRYQVRVLYGTFESIERAQEAARRLPPKYQRAFQIEPRSFLELRNAV